VLAPYCDARLEIYNFDVSASSYSGIS
jgi:hypothetical protein